MSKELDLLYKNQFKHTAFRPLGLFPTFENTKQIEIITENNKVFKYEKGGNSFTNEKSGDICLISSTSDFFINNFESNIYIQINFFLNDDSIKTTPKIFLHEQKKKTSNPPFIFFLNCTKKEWEETSNEVLIETNDKKGVYQLDSSEYIFLVFDIEQRKSLQLFKSFKIFPFEQEPIFWEIILQNEGNGFEFCDSVHFSKTKLRFRIPNKLPPEYKMGTEIIVNPPKGRYVDFDASKENVLGFKSNYKACNVFF